MLNHHSRALLARGLAAMGLLLGSVLQGQYIRHVGCKGAL